jgi:hypothetical protein
MEKVFSVYLLSLTKGVLNKKNEEKALCSETSFRELSLETRLCPEKELNIFPKRTEIHKEFEQIIKK